MYFLFFILINVAFSSVETISFQKQCTYYYDSHLKKNVYNYVDEMPEYPGGMTQLGSDFGRRYREPKAERFQGFMKFEFIIDTNGNMTGIRVQGKQEKEATPYEKEGLKVLRSLPKWKVGKCNGKVVPVKILFPVHF